MLEEKNHKMDFQLKYLSKELVHLTLRAVTWKMYVILNANT